MKKTDITQKSGNDKLRSALSVAKKVGRIALKAVGNLLVVLCITGAIVGLTMLGYVSTLMDISVDLDLKTNKMIETSYIYKTTASGEQEVMTKLHGVENREWVDLDKIPKDLQNAFIAIEDKRFYDHDGVDWRRTIFAAVNLFTNTSNIKQGGSTITQQLIKNRTGDNASSIQRKLREIFSALNVEKEYTKPEILEAYLNTINLGNGTYGVQAAAKSYFGKTVDQLTLLECTALAGITQNPTYYNPYFWPENNKIRRHLVMDFMLEQGKISKEQYDEIYNAELVLANQVDPDTNPDGTTGVPSTPVAKGAYDYYSDLVINDVINDLMEQYGWSEATAETKLFQGGLRIYAAVDDELQKISEQVLLNGTSLPKDEKLQAAIFAMDYTGRVTATVGRRGQKTDKRGWNNAIDGVRQPGSAIKPLSVYAYAVENDYIGWSTLIDDQPDHYLGDNSLWPRNSYASYRGLIPAQKALEISSNAAAAKLAYTIGMEPCFYFMRNKFHIESLVEKSIIINGQKFNDINLSTLATGGMTNGATVKELTAAYAVFGSGGKYYEPYSYYYVTDKDGNVLLDNRNVAYEQIISEETAYIVNQLLQSIVEGNEGTAMHARISGWNLFGKTGTTSNNKDRIYMGGTPYGVAGVWVGYETPKKINTWNHPAVPIWKEIMQKYLANQEKLDYSIPNGVVQQSYCLASGGFATPECPAEMVRTGWFKKNSTAVTVCDVHDGDATTDENLKYEIITDEEKAALDAAEGEAENGETSEGETEEGTTENTDEAA